MAKTGFITVQTATTTQKGVTRIATQEEVNAGTATDAVITPETLQNKPISIPEATESIAGIAPLATTAESIAGQVANKIITPKTLSDTLSNAISGLKFAGLKYEKFVDDIQLQPNYMYICTDPGVKPPADAKLPPRGTGKQGDIIIVYNLTTYENVSFKVTLNTDLVLHHDGQVITDLDGKYLLGDKGGSCVLLGCGGNQQWFSLLHYQITLTAGQVLNSQTKNVLRQ